ncbi:beta-propeller domain-containing protein [bacterium]|nr:beta-propeller domain-containing protein [bacterium]
MNSTLPNHLLRLIGAAALAFVIIAIAFLGTACQNHSAGSSGDEDTASRALGLVRCQDCEEVLDWMRLVALTQVERAAAQAIDGARESDDAMGGAEGDNATGGDDDAPGDPNGESGDGADDDHSDTNVQEQGVDEADIVKTDGEWIYLLAGGNFIIADARPAAQMHEAARLALAGHPRELFVAADLAIIFSTTAPGELPDDVWPELPREELGTSIFVTQIVDIADRASPRVLRTLYAEGSYVSARRVDNLVRIVLVSRPFTDAIENWVDPWSYFDGGVPEDDAAFDQAVGEMLDDARAAIESSTLEDWIPRYFDRRAGGEMSAGFLSKCADYYRPQEPLGGAVSTILTIDLSQPYDKQEDVGLLADGQLLYATTDSLYVAEEASAVHEWIGEDVRRSMIHKFATPAGATQASYVGTGEIDGFVLNQFSMSEFEGNLRVAASTGWWGEELSSMVYVLRPADGLLEVAGEIRGIAPGEELKSARFFGERGYVVTFEQTDPLFVIDLSDPTDPRVAGELEIPGFSTYIHPVDDNHIVTIGEAGDENGLTGGVLLQVFDVADAANPVRTFEELVATGWDVYSPAVYDPKAFLYYPPAELLAIPVVEYGWDEGGEDVPGSEGGEGAKSGDAAPPPAEQGDEPADGADEATGRSFLAVYRFNVAEGFSEWGAVEHTDLSAEAGSDWFGEVPITRRGLVIGDAIYSLSDAALVATSLETFEDLASIALPYSAEDAWGDGWSGGGSTGGGDGVPEDEPVGD